MKNFTGIAEATCPKCGAVYRAPAALSRVDNCTPICPECGILESLASIGVSGDEAAQILDIIKKHTAGGAGSE